MTGGGSVTVGVIGTVGVGVGVGVGVSIPVGVGHVIVPDSEKSVIKSLVVRA